jgi:predicted MFS family arabinose efflux permease
MSAVADGGAPQRFSTRAAFFIAGFGMAAWAPLVPFAKARSGLDDGGLGLLLLGLGAGSIIAMPLAGALTARVGCRRVIVAASLGIALTLPWLAWLSSAPALALALALFGASVGAIDCAANVQAVMVERAAARPLMSGFHGLFSLGGIVGAGGVALLLGAGVTPLAAALVVVTVCLTVLTLSQHHLLNGRSEARGPAFARPRGIVLFIGALCFIAFLAEGAVLDWSAVFLVGERDVDMRNAGLAYAAFSVAMTLCRLFGDRIVKALGPRRVLVLGGSCAAGGFALALLAGATPLALAGFALVGVGCSNIVPVLYSALGRQKTMPEHLAVPAVTTLGYAGILAGPAAIGALAHGIGLSWALAAVGAAMLVIAASAPLFRRD